MRPGRSSSSFSPFRDADSIMLTAKQDAKGRLLRAKLEEQEKNNFTASGAKLQELLPGLTDPSFSHWAGCN